MADKTIKQLSTELTTLQPDDWFIAQRDSDNETGKVKASNVFGGGWNPLTAAPSAVTHNGNRSYSLTFTGVDLTSLVSNGMRLRTTRSSNAPTRCTDLEASSSQYFSKTSPNKLTFTDDFVVSAWVKIESYPSRATIASRENGTSGWLFDINADGTVRLTGYSGSLSNFSLVQSYQSVPLNRWVHIAAQLDMSAFTATTTTSYIMLDGVNVPATVSRGGTNPTSLTQAGNLEIGSRNGGTHYFDGKIAQVAIYSAKVTQSTIQNSMNQGLTGSETSLASAYSFNNSITDLNTSTPNDLTAVNSAAATNTDSPFGCQADGSISATLDYGIVMQTSFSTDTTMVVQVPEGCTIPTTGGVVAASYSTQKAAYGFPVQKGKWNITTLLKTQNSTTSNATYGSFISGGWALTVPIGEWYVGYDMELSSTSTTRATFNLSPTSIAGVALGAEDTRFSADVITATNTAGTFVSHTRRIPQTVTSAASTYVIYTLGATTGAVTEGDNSLCQLIAENAYI